MKNKIPIVTKLRKQNGQITHYRCINCKEWNGLMEFRQKIDNLYSVECGNCHFEMMIKTDK